MVSSNVSELRYLAFKLNDEDKHGAPRSHMEQELIEASAMTKEATTGLYRLLPDDVKDAMKGVRIGEALATLVCGHSVNTVPCCLKLTCLLGETPPTVLLVPSGDGGITARSVPYSEDICGKIRTAYRSVQGRYFVPCLVCVLMAPPALPSSPYLPDIRAELIFVIRQLGTRRAPAFVKPMSHGKNCTAVLEKRFHSKHL